VRSSSCGGRMEFSSSKAVRRRSIGSRTITRSTTSSSDSWIASRDRNSSSGRTKGRTYAPAKFARHDDANGITSAEFEKAMQRLIDAGKIHIVTSGPPSKRRSSLAFGPREQRLVE
jgi:hypothetical protein